MPYTLLAPHERDAANVTAYMATVDARNALYRTWMHRGWDTDQYAYERALVDERDAWYAAFTLSPAVTPPTGSAPAAG